MLGSPCGRDGNAGTRIVTKVKTVRVSYDNYDCEMSLMMEVTARKKIISRAMMIEGFLVVRMSKASVELLALSISEARTFRSFFSFEVFQVYCSLR